MNFSGFRILQLSFPYFSSTNFIFPEQPDARADGKILLEHLVKVLAEVDKLEQHAKPILDSLEGKPQQISNQVQMNANSLHLAATDLRDFLESLRPQSPGESPNTAEGGQDEGQPVDAVRKKLDEQNTSVVDSVKTGLSSIVPMLDPPLHKSIFGFDVQRGCMLARYRGARQLWVQRPGGGMLDVIHFPAKSTGPPSTRNPKAVLYCNPNAGLIEVATGISLAGGNVASDAEGVVNDNCWTDFYTNAGFDVYMFNYAGFGRSYGAGFCGVGKRGGEENHVPSFLGRMQRIFHGVFLSFQVSVYNFVLFLFCWHIYGTSKGNGKRRENSPAISFWLFLFRSANAGLATG